MACCWMQAEAEKVSRMRGLIRSMGGTSPELNPSLSVHVMIGGGEGVSLWLDHLIRPYACLASSPFPLILCLLLSALIYARTTITLFPPPIPSSPGSHYARTGGRVPPRAHSMPASIRRKGRRDASSVSRETQKSFQFKTNF